MCGITACVGEGASVEGLLDCLKNLEYRGYDSAGIAVRDGRRLDVRKCDGTVEDLIAELPDAGGGLRARTGIAHTRWSTHGPPTRRNAHPHTDCTGEVAIVHNGIIENYEGLRRELRSQGHVFESETDTEVIAHLIESRLSRGMTTEEAFRSAFDKVSGSYAVAAVFAGEDAIYATRDGSPLVFGEAANTRFVASDVPAFIQHTDQVVFLEDGDFLRADAEGFRITNRVGTPIDRTVETIDWEPDRAEKAGYDHYMLKEIYEQPDAIRRGLRDRIAPDGTAVRLDEAPPGTFDDIREVHLVGMGTSYHAAKYVESLLMDWGVRARAELAGPYAYNPPPVDERTLVIAVTQSGETADTLKALETATEADARTLAVTNVVGSSVTRNTDESLFIRAGPEIGVAATKTFSSQIATLLLLGIRLATDITGEVNEATQILQALRQLPDRIERLLETTSAQATAERFSDSDAYFFIGREFAHAVALEGALKLKEISYIHAEGFPASQLKHGPLALVTDTTPVIAVLTGRNDDATIGNINEVEARGAPVIVISNGRTEGVTDRFDQVVRLPGTHPAVAGILANVKLQLFSYYAADLIGRPIDKPRNLAKSVTVE